MVISLLKKIFTYLFSKKEFLLRVLFCWALGIVIIAIDKTPHLDLRYKIRGDKASTSPIVITSVKLTDWQKYFPVQSLLETSNSSSNYDNLFGNLEAWSTILDKLLKKDPKFIGITFFLDESTNSDEALNQYPFNDPRIHWSAKTNADGRLQYSKPENSNYNFQLTQFFSDSDDVYRSFQSPLLHVQHMSLKASQSIKPYTNYNVGELLRINLYGRDDYYKNLSLDDLMNNNNSNPIKNSIVLIGGHYQESKRLNTALGDMSVNALTANAIDNFLNKSWIKIPSFYTLCLLFLLFSFLFARVSVYYPQPVTFIIYILILVIYSGFSLWFFDTHYVWTPILSLIFLAGCTYVVFLSFQISNQENQIWRLEKEKVFSSEVEELKSNFISLFSHDLKTPLAKIQAISDRLIQENKSEKLNNDLELLKAEGEELNRSIQSILKLSRVESRSLKLNREPHDLNEIILQSQKSLKPLADKKSLTMDTQLTPLFLSEFDALLIKEVVSNIIENAIKYTDNGGSIIISSDETNNDIVLKVFNTGQTLSQSEASQVFEKFYRSPQFKDTQKGSGLGLYLSKYFIELHGGKMYFKAIESQGTEVGFTLPLS